MGDVEFQVADYHCHEDGDWRIACVHEVEANMSMVEEALSGKDWHICALMDGSVSGPGYGHEISHEVKELGHKLLIKCPTQFQVLEYHCSGDPGWRMPTVREIEADMDKVQEALCDKEWHICALIDGTVSGPGYGHEIGYQAKEMGHKIVVNRPAPPVEFDVAEYNCCGEGGWRMARIGEVRADMDKVKDVLCDKEWHICALVDGSVSGPGYSHEICEECKEMGHKLMIKGGVEPPPAEFQVVEYHDATEGHWRLARIADVKANEEKVHEVLADKEWHICALVDGSVSGPGYSYEIGHEVKELGHKLIINY